MKQIQMNQLREEIIKIFRTNYGSLFSSNELIKQLSKNGVETYYEKLHSDLIYLCDKHILKRENIFVNGKKLNKYRYSLYESKSTATNKDVLKIAKSIDQTLKLILFALQNKKEYSDDFKAFLLRPWKNIHDDFKKVLDIGKDRKKINK